MSARAGRATTEGRQLAYAVLFCVAGAGLALYAATRIWSVELTSRPAPLPPLRDTHTGGALLPWLSALALVGLAGAGAVLATRATVRRLIGAFLLLVALGMAGGGGYGVLALDRGEGSPAWPVLCALGGVVAAGGAALTVARGQRWPVMGARYERAVAAPASGTARDVAPHPTGVSGTDGAPATGVSGRAGAPTNGAAVPGGADGSPDRTARVRFEGRRTVEAWDALDRGEDPTISGPSGQER